MARTDLRCTGQLIPGTLTGPAGSYGGVDMNVHHRIAAALAEPVPGAHP